MNWTVLPWKPWDIGRFEGTVVVGVWVGRWMLTLNKIAASPSDRESAATRKV
jgi:hypothetical protein